MKRYVFLGMILLAGSSPAWARQAEGAPQAGKEQLAAAYAIKKQSFKKEGLEKKEILIQAAEAYRKVATLFPDDRKSCALAAFRIGEIYRGLQDREQAEKAFQKVLTYHDQHHTVARALMELGHLHRREKYFDLAIDLYGQVRRQCPGEQELGARAAIWIGKCYRTKKAYAEARDALQVVIEEYRSDTKNLIAAYDLLATCYIEDGNAKLGEEVLRECKEYFQALQDESKDENRDVMAKVAKMKAWKLLEKAKSRAEGV